MHSSAWDIAKTSPATAHIPLDEQLAYADLYAAIDNWRAFLAEESANSVELSALVASADFIINGEHCSRAFRPEEVSDRERGDPWRNARKARGQAADRKAGWN